MRNKYLTYEEKCGQLNVSFIGNKIHIKFSLIFKQLSTLGDSVNAVSQVMSTISGNIPQIQGLAASIHGLSTEQAILAMSTAKVSPQLMTEALIANGVEKEVAEAAVAHTGLSTSQGVAIGTTKSLSTAFKGLAASLGISTAALGVITGVVAALGVAAVAISAYNKAKEESRQKAIESIDAYKEEQHLLEDQIKKYKELTKAIESGNLSVEETVIKKEELLGIQNNLINTFGDEAEGIDLVNGKYQEQLDLLQNISKQSAANIVAENANKFGDAKKEIEKIRTYDIGHIANWSDLDPFSEQDNKLVNFIKYYSDLFKVSSGGRSHGNHTYSFAELKVEANVEDADKVLHDFSADLRKFGDENNIDVSNILESISIQLDKTWTEELTEYKKIYDEYATALVMSNDKTRSAYAESIDAVEAFNNAVISGEGYDEAKTKLESLMSTVKDLTSGLENGEEMWRIFQEIFGNKERSREERVFDLKEKFGLHHNDKTLETFFANENVDIELFERIAAVSKTAADAIKMYRTEVAAAAEETTSFAISPEEAEALSDYQSKIDSISSSLADLHNLTSSDITSLMTEFKDNKDAMAIFEKFGVNGKAGVGDLKSALEEIGKLLMETAKDKVPQMSDAIEDMYSVIGNPKGNIQKLASELEELEDVLSRVRNGEAYSDVEVTNLINKYPELSDAVQILTDGYSLEEDAIISLLNARITQSNEAVSYELEDAKAAVEAIQARIQARMAEQRLLQRTGKAAAYLDENGEVVYSGYTSNEEFQNDLKELAIAEETLERLKKLVREPYSTGDKDLEEAAKKFASIRDILETELNGSISDNRRLEIYKALETAIADDYNAQIEIAKAEGDTLAIEKLELEKKQALADLDQQRIDLARELDDAEISRLEKIRTELQNQIDLNGGKGTAEQYTKLISNERSIAAELTADLERENKLLIEIESTLGKNSTAYREQEQKVNDIADGIAECEKNTKEWGKEILNLAIDAINDSIDGLNKKLEQNQNAQDEMDSIIAGAVAYIQDEIDAQEELKQGIQDQIDALQEANDERERALALEKAKYELERAMSQRTVKVYKGEGKGFVYEQDREAVRNAQENLSNLEFEETIHALEKQIEYYDDIIEDLQEVQDAWSNIRSDAEDYLNIEKALEAIGVEGIFDTAKIEEYSVTMRGLLETEQQINDEIKTWQAFLAAVEEISSKHTYNALSMEEAIDAIQKAGDEFLPKLEEFKSLSEDGTPDTEKMANVIEEIKRAYLEGYSEMVDGAEGAGDDTKGVLSEVVQAAMSDNDAIEKDTKDTYDAITVKLKEEIDEQKIALEQLKTDMTTLFADIYTVVNNGLLDGLNAFSANVLTSCKFIEKQISNLDKKLKDTEKAVDELTEKKGGGSSFVTVQAFHTGLEKGLVGEKQAGEGLKKVALRKLEPDEVPAVLKVNEAVLTQLQQQNVMSNIGAAYRAGVNTSVIKNNSSTPVVQNVTLTLPNVTNESGYNRLVQELQGLQLDALQFAKRR